MTAVILFLFRKLEARKEEEKSDYRLILYNILKCFQTCCVFLNLQDIGFKKLKPSLAELSKTISF